MPQLVVLACPPWRRLVPFGLPSGPCQLHRFPVQPPLPQATRRYLPRFRYQLVFNRHCFPQ
jgi:hypothetical protein